MIKNKHYYIHQSSIIDEDVSIGLDTKVWHFSHILRNSRLGSNVSIGQGCMIGPNVVVGNGSRLQNNVSLFEGIIAENNVFFGPSSVFTNVKNPRSNVNRRDLFQKTILREGATIGANATIVCGVELGRNCLIAAGSVVTKSVPSNALMAGNPAKQIGWVSDSGFRLNDDNFCKYENQHYYLDKKSVLRKKQNKKIGIIIDEYEKGSLVLESLINQEVAFDIFCNEDHQKKIIASLSSLKLSKYKNTYLIHPISLISKISIDYDHLLLLGDIHALPKDTKLDQKFLGVSNQLFSQPCSVNILKNSKRFDSTLGCTLFNYISQDQIISLNPIKNLETYLFKDDSLEDFLTRETKTELYLLSDFLYHLENQNLIEPFKLKKHKTKASTNEMLFKIYKSSMAI